MNKRYNENLLVFLFFTILLSFSGLVFFVCLKFSSNWQYKLKSLFNFESRFKFTAKNCIQKEVLENNSVKTLNSYVVDLTGKSLVTGVYKKGSTLLKIPILPEKRKVDLCCKFISDFCDSKSSIVYFLLLPTKFQLNGGFAGSAYFNSYEKDLIQFFYSKLNGRVVDLNSNVFSAYLENIDFFYRTDSSFNSFGNFLIYSSMIKQMGNKPIDMSNFMIKTANNKFYGDLFNSRFVDQIQPDTIDIFEYVNSLINLKFTFRVQQIYNKNLSEFRESIFDFENKEKVLFGDKAPVKIVENNLSKNSLLIFSDGSVDGLMQFLSPHFKKIKVVDLAEFKKLRNNEKEYMSKLEKEFDNVLFVYGIESLHEPQCFSQLYWFMF